MRHSLRQTLLELRRIDLEAEAALDIEKLIRTRQRVFSKLKNRITDLEQIRLEAFKQSLRDIGRPDDMLALHLNEIYLKHRYEDIELFEDVVPTLKALRQRYTIGLVSNGNSYPERCGLEDTFLFHRIRYRVRRVEARPKDFPGSSREGRVLSTGASARR